MTVKLLGKLGNLLLILETKNPNKHKIRLVWILKFSKKH